MRPVKEKDVLSETARRVYRELFPPPVAVQRSFPEGYQSDFMKHKSGEAAGKVRENKREPTSPLRLRVVSKTEGEPFIPDLLKIINYARSYVESEEKSPKLKPIIGELPNLIGQVLCLVAGLPYVVRGGTGSGKTLTTDKVLALLPAEEIYVASESTESAFYRDCHNINGARILYAPEIQKAVSNKMVREMVKNLTEGKTAGRRRVDWWGNVQMDQINSGIIFVATCALENDYMKKEDKELKRRILNFYTDESEEHIKEANQYQASQRGPSRVRNVLRRKDYRQLAEHVRSCMDKRFDFVDPFESFLGEIIPGTPKSIGYKEHYFNLLDACAKFHHPCLVIEGNKLYLSLEDHFIVYSLYHRSFCQTLAEFDSEPKWQRLIEEAQRPVNWQEWWEKGCRAMAETDKSPAQPLYLRWREMQLSEEGLGAYNPFNGEGVLLLKAEGS